MTKGLKMKNILRTRWLITLMLIAGIQVANARSVVNQHRKTESCSGGMVYLNMPNGADLKERPSDKSRTVMKLYYRQYLCVVEDNGVEPDRWVKVKKVPLAVEESEMTCESMGLEKGCTTIKDYPARWQVAKPRGGQCRVKIFSNREEILVRTKGVCATGWVRGREIVYFAD